VLEARLAELEQRIADTQLRAPFAGTVTARRAEVGAWLGEGAALVELVSTEELELWLDVPQDLFAALARSEDGGLGPLEVRAGASGALLEVERYRVVPDVDPRARTFRIVASLDATARRELAAGMSVTAVVPTGERAEQLTVPRDALLRNDVGTYVYAVVGEGQAAQAVPLQVEVLFGHEGRAVVRPGRLAAGMQVVVEGNERLFPMAPVQPIAAGARGAAPAPDAPREAGDARPAPQDEPAPR
jgi:RND family efflux transporter MFP subunit